MVSDAGAGQFVDFNLQKDGQGRISNRTMFQENGFNSDCRGQVKSAPGKKSETIQFFDYLIHQGLLFGVITF